MEPTFIALTQLAFSVYLANEIDGANDVYENSIGSLQQIVDRFYYEGVLNKKQSIVIMRTANGYYAQGGNNHE